MGILCKAMVNSADPDKIPHPESSVQGLHCLITECFIKIGINIKNTSQQYGNGLI